MKKSRTWKSSESQDMMNLISSSNLMTTLMDHMSLATERIAGAPHLTLVQADAVMTTIIIAGIDGAGMPTTICTVITLKNLSLGNDAAGVLTPKMNTIESQRASTKVRDVALMTNPDKPVNEPRRKLRRLPSLSHLLDSRYPRSRLNSSSSLQNLGLRVATRRPQAVRKPFEDQSKTRTSCQ